MQFHMMRCVSRPEGEVEQEPAHGEAAGQGGVGQPEAVRDVGLLLQHLHPAPQSR